MTKLLLLLLSPKVKGHILGYYYVTCLFRSFWLNLYSVGILVSFW